MCLNDVIFCIFTVTKSASFGKFLNIFSMMLGWLLMGLLKVTKNHLIFKYNSPNIFGSATSFHEVVLQFIKNVLRSLNYLFTVVVGSVAVDVAAAVVVGGDSNLRLHHRLVDVAQVEGLW